jgi:hypothetical protein
VVVVALVMLGVQAGQLSRAALQGAHDRASLVALADRFPGNTAYAALLARADIVSGRLTDATERLEGALGRNPASAGLWLDLGRAAVSRGDDRAAVRAAVAARRRAPRSADVCYQAAVLLLEADAAAEALPALRCAVDLDPQRATDVYGLAWAVVADGALIRQAVVPDDAAGWRGYVSYARARRAEEAAPAWAHLVRHGASAAERFAQIDFLVKRGRGAEAAGIWAEAYGPRPESLVHNGSFEAEPPGGGLGWMLGGHAGARTAIAARADAPDGRRVLQVTFEGANVDYQHASQIVPVVPGQRYRLRAMVRTDGLRSTSVPRLAVRGYAACPLGEIGGREWKGTVPWTAETFDFDVPPGCSVILVHVRRRPGGRFGGSISGTLWLDRVAIQAIGDEAA